MIILNKRLYKFLVIIGALGLSSCSEDRQIYPNLSEVGDRPKEPSIKNAKETIVKLRQDKIILLNE